MKIEAESKFNEGDVIYYINNNFAPRKSVIMDTRGEIKVIGDEFHVNFFYTVREDSFKGDRVEYPQGRLFATQEELIESINKKLSFYK